MFLKNSGGDKDAKVGNQFDQGERECLSCFYRDDEWTAVLCNDAQKDISGKEQSFFVVSLHEHSTSDTMSSHHFTNSFSKNVKS